MTEVNRRISLLAYMRLIRPHQWVKNFIIFLPLFFGLQITNLNLLLATTIAFVSFSLVASAIYVFNDLYDIEEDRNHPRKRFRPLASGQISRDIAKSVFLLLLALGIGVPLFFGEKIVYLLILYVLINIVYTRWLKHISIIDVFTIASGFVIRIFVGSLSSGVHLSMWIILMTFILALFLALAKRRDDVLISIHIGQQTRRSTSGYSLEFLNSVMVMMAAIVVIFYIMYTVSLDVTVKLHGDKLYFSIVFVLMGIMRYLQISLVDHKSGSPTKIFYTDRLIQFSLIGWLATLTFILYL